MAKPNVYKLDFVIDKLTGSIPMLNPKLLLLFSFLFGICSIANSQMNSSNSVASVFNNTESITGKPQNLNTPYNTAGDKLYMVGNQDGGTFLDL